MRKFAKYILIAAGLVLSVYVLAILGLNIYLQSEGLQKRIQTAAEAAAGSPVRITGTNYTPWSGFSITGISVCGTSGAGQPPFLAATSVSFRFSVLALLQGKLVVSEVVVANPFLVARPDEPPPAPKTRVTAANPPPSTPLPEAPDHQPSEVVITVPEPATLTSPTPPMVEVNSLRVTNGQAQFYDSKGALAITLAGVEVSGELLPDRSAAGTFSIADTQVGAFVHPSHVRGTFTWKNGRLVIPDLQADWAGGQLTGRLEIGQDKEISISAAAEGILIKKLA